MALNIEFPTEQVEAFHKAARELNDLAPEISKAEACGIECQGLRAVVEEMQRRIDLMRRSYPQLTTPGGQRQ